jgi:Protein of unknown function (DUF4043)
MIQRRGFLAGLLALGAAPAIVTSKGFLPTHQPIVAAGHATGGWDYYDTPYFDHEKWDDHPLFRGEVGRYNGIIIHETKFARPVTVTAGDTVNVTVTLKDRPKPFKIIAHPSQAATLSKAVQGSDGRWRLA